ncbi:MAG: hypothetical protein ACOC6A_06955, partial [Chloroflexota bacterium]
KFILQTPHKYRTSIDWIAPEESVTWVRTWEEVVAELQRDYPAGARAAVIPDASIQYFDVVATLHYL